MVDWGSKQKRLCARAQPFLFSVNFRINSRPFVLIRVHSRLAFSPCLRGKFWLWSVPQKFLARNLLNDDLQTGQFTPGSTAMGQNQIRQTRPMADNPFSTILRLETIFIQRCGPPRQKLPRPPCPLRPPCPPAFVLQAKAKS